jgi:hypothetical protein
MAGHLERIRKKTNLGTALSMCTDKKMELNLTGLTGTGSIRDGGGGGDDNDHIIIQGYSKKDGPR